MQIPDGEENKKNKFLTFVFFGGLNTATTYLLYLLLSNFLHHQFAYLISYASGIALAYILNLLFVFDSKSTLRKVMRYPFIYLIQYILGASLLYILLTVFSLHNAIAPLLVALCLLPISYLMNKIVLTPN